MANQLIDQPTKQVTKWLTDLLTKQQTNNE